VYRTKHYFEDFLWSGDFTCLCISRGSFHTPNTLRWLKTPAFFSEPGSAKSHFRSKLLGRIFGKPAFIRGENQQLPCFIYTHGRKCAAKALPCVSIHSRGERRLKTVKKAASANRNETVTFPLPVSRAQEIDVLGVNNLAKCIELAGGFC
jgi:hypothetical protein